MSKVFITEITYRAKICVKLVDLAEIQSRDQIRQRILLEKERLEEPVDLKIPLTVVRRPVTKGINGKLSVFNHVHRGADHVPNEAQLFEVTKQNGVIDQVRHKTHFRMNRNDRHVTHFT